MKTQIGTAITGDFEANTMTFEIEGAMVLAAGKYAIVPIEDYDKLVKNNVVLDNVSNSVRQEIERRRDLIINEPNGIVRETMISNLAIDL